MSKMKDQFIDERNAHQEQLDAFNQRLIDQQEEEYFLKPILPEGITAQQIVQPILDGFKSPITGYEEIHRMIQVLTQAKEMIYDEAVEEIERYGKDSVPSKYGHKITVKAGRRQFKYNDPVIKALQAKLKYYQQCAKDGVATEDGEMFDKPEITYTKDTINISK